MSGTIFFEISQDGIGFIARDNSSYSGLCTSGLETCMASIIYLDSGIVLVHDSGQLDFTKIKEFILSKGKVEKMCFFEKEKECIAIYDEVAIQNNRLRRSMYMSLLNTMPTLQVSKTPNGCVYVDKNNGITTDVPWAIIEQAENCILRNAITECNNAFSQKNSQSLVPDIQFDNEQVYTLPNLIYSKIKMEQMIDDSIAAGNSSLTKVLSFFYEKYELAGEMLDETKLSLNAQMALNAWLDIQLCRQD